MSNALNVTTVGAPRTNDRSKFYLHVSDVLENTGPRAFCPRYWVLAYHSSRVRGDSKISPARELLFATGHFFGDYVVDKVLKRSPFAGAVYGNWSCSKWRPNQAETWGGNRGEVHIPVEDIRDNVIGKKCVCGRPLSKHNEVDLVLPSLNLTGHPDILFLIGDTYNIREEKSWDRKDTPFDDLVVPDPKHTLQVSFYYKMLMAKAKAEGRNVSRKLVIDYADRSNSKLFGGLPFKSLATKPVADEFINPIRNQLLHVKEGFKTRRLPDRICPDIKSTRARNCELAVECFARRKSIVVQPKVHNRS